MKAIESETRIKDGLVALFAAKPVPDALVNVPLLSRQLTPDVIVSHGKALRRPPGGPEEQFLYTRVYVHDGGTWLLAANQIARPSEHVRPSGIGH